METAAGAILFLLLKDVPVTEIKEALASHDVKTVLMQVSDDDDDVMFDDDDDNDDAEARHETKKTEKFDGAKTAW